MWFWMVALLFFRRMAKADPPMRYVYMRRLLYRRYYPARSTPYRENRTRLSEARNCMEGYCPASAEIICKLSRSKKGALGTSQIVKVSDCNITSEA
jgi:hypothetical protein